MELRKTAEEAADQILNKIPKRFWKINDRVDKLTLMRAIAAIGVLCEGHLANHEKLYLVRKDKIGKIYLQTSDKTVVDDDCASAIIMASIREEGVKPIDPEDASAMLNWMLDIFAYQPALFGLRITREKDGTYGVSVPN